MRPTPCAAARGLSAIAAALLPLVPASAQRATRPNLLIVVADDLGIEQVGVYGIGSAPPPTPNIDRLAGRGVLFQNAWSNPVCSPTRACVQTGRYSFRTGVGTAILPNGGVLEPDEITIPELLDLRGAGYATGAFGKWHLADARNGGALGPNIAGWSYYAGFLYGGTSYFIWPHVVNGTRLTVTTYQTTQTVDDALGWIATAPEPWIAYVAFSAPHYPWHEPPSYLHTYHLPPNPTAHQLYKAMAEALDTELGRLLDGLGPAIDRTNVLFFSDNGSPHGIVDPPFANYQSKATCYQGGIRVPLIAAGPAVRSPGRAVDEMVGLVDVFATAAELCGVDPELPWIASDSVSMVPYLQNPGQPALRTRLLAESFDGQAPASPALLAYRDQRYKLMQWTGSGREELYDLSSDPWERNDLLLQLSLSPTEQRAYDTLRGELTARRAEAPVVSDYGSATCAGSAGVPSIATLGAPSPGASYSVTLAGAAPRTFAGLALGASRTHWGALALPLALSPYGGGAGCALQNSIDLLLPAVTDAGGNATLAAGIPDLPVLIGGSIHQSWLIADPQAPGNALGVVTTHGQTVTIGRR